VLALFLGGWYLGRYGGEFGVASHVALARPGAPVATSPVAHAGGADAAASDPAAAGRAIFTKSCQACHQPNGRGLPGTFPPLVGSEWVTGDPETPTRILLHGLQGPVTVAGAAYNGAMPAWREQLSDPEIAAVLTYLRQWAPNAAPAVPATLVASLRAATTSRATPWTSDELRKAQGSAGVTGTGAPGATP
jgi:mono/diheme cytochrome c family protein